MLNPTKNTFNAFVSEFWANGINLLVSTMIKWFLDGQHQYSFVVKELVCLSCRWDSVFDIRPYVKSVISIQNDNLFHFPLSNMFIWVCVFLSLGLIIGGSFWSMRGKELCNLLQISFVCCVANYINNFMEWHIWMFSHVIISKVSQDTIIRNFWELYCILRMTISKLAVEILCGACFDLLG